VRSEGRSRSQGDIDFEAVAQQEHPVRARAAVQVELVHNVKLANEPNRPVQSWRTDSNSTPFRTPNALSTSDQQSSWPTERSGHRAAGDPLIGASNGEEPVQSVWM
jgi:hypothetical protein